MKIKNNTILFVFALSTLASTLGSCRSEDDVLNGLPQGSVPLVLGDVTVAGAQTVNNRAAGGNTRAAISENAAIGYTGIRKSRFVDGDVLNLTLSNGSGSGSGESTSVTATLTGGKWVLAPAKVFITPGVTTVSATHTATEQTAGIATDDLTAAHADCVLTAATGKLAISMKHAGAMIDITPGATDGATITSVTVNTDVPTVAEEESVTGGSGTELHYRTLTAATTVVNGISAVIGGTTYTATLAAPITVAANKRYPVALSFKHQTLTATPSAPQDWTDGGTVPVPGYTRIIDSPEALAQLTQDVNDGKLDAGSACILQTADIDLSRLMTATEANAARPGKNYTYTATADNWVVIGSSSGHPFKCKYNGNGHTISNLKMTNNATGCGLFGYVSGTITGVHLRGFSATGIMGQGGTLAMQVFTGGTISLCSATGTVSMNSGTLGGLLGSCGGQSHVSRCSADVDVRMEDASSGTLGGFIGAIGQDSFVTGCSSAGNVDWGTSGSKIGGFIGSVAASQIMGCYSGGTLRDATAKAFIGYLSGNLVKSNYCVVAGADFCTSSAAIADNAYAGTTAMSASAVTGNVSPDAAYAILTATNASVANQRTLHWSAAEGYTLTGVTSTWYATDIWKDNGTAAPTIDLMYEGFDGKYEGTTSNLLEIDGQTAYYVAPVDAGTDIEWGNIDFNTICPKGWHVPTKDEFVAMTGIPADDASHGDNNDAIKAVFPAGGNYWSSTESGLGAWYLYVNTDGTSYIYAYIKTSSYRVRCVRAK